MNPIMQCPCTTPSTPFHFLFATHMRKVAGEQPIIGEFLQCENCGLLRLAEEQCLNEDAYTSDAYRESVGQDVSSEKQLALHAQLNELIVHHLNLPPNEVIIDIGAGAGGVLDLLKPTAEATAAIEPNQVLALELAKRHAWFESTQSALEQDNAGKATRALCILTLEHLADPWQILLDAANLLAPHGRLNVVVPALNGERAWRDPSYRIVWFCAQHRWYFTPDSLGNMLRVAGFAAQRVEQWTRPDDWTYWHLEATKC